MNSEANRFSLISSRTLAHKTGIPIAALDISPSRTHAILAGREILKTIQVSESTCAEDINLRSAIIAYAATHDVAGGVASAKHKHQIAANDVKWSHGRFASTIAVAAANGQIAIYDINRTGVESGRLHEHVRQVHRVAFNPHQGALLLSGSQDATVRLWDLRDLAGHRSVMTCRSAHQYLGNNEGIRDLRWSPTNGVEFAASTDNGVIQRWDFRKDKTPLLKINAHEKTCHAIDWHPDGKHLVSGGADKQINIWDLLTTDRRKKPCWRLRTPQAVLNVRWRPAEWRDETSTQAGWQCAQLATSYDHHDPRIHIWDLRRQHMPLRQVDFYDTPPTGMLWHSEDRLWSVNTAGMFTQTDVSLATELSAKRNPNLIAIGPRGNLGFFSHQRISKRRSLQDASKGFLERRRNKSSSDDRLSGSHSATDGSMDEPSSLSSSVAKIRRKAPNSRALKSTASMPLPAGASGPTLKLDEVLKKEFIFHPLQAAAQGHVLGLFDFASFGSLARNYSLPKCSSFLKSTQPWHQLLCAHFQENANLAAVVCQYKLAQTWQILKIAIEKQVRSDSLQNGLNVRYIRSGNLGRSLMLQNGIDNSSNSHIISDTKDDSTSQAEIAQDKLAAPRTADNSSNMTTPIARPVPDALAQPGMSDDMRISSGDGSLSLPGPVWANGAAQPSRNCKSGDSTTNSPRQSSEMAAYDEKSKRILSPNANDYPPPNSLVTVSPVTGFLDMDTHLNERRAAMDSYRAKPRPLLRLDEPAPVLRGDHLAPLLDRHGSSESFQLFSASSDGSYHAKSVAGSFGSSQGSERPGVPHEAWMQAILHKEKNAQTQNDAPIAAQIQHSVIDRSSPSPPAPGQTDQFTSLGSSYTNFQRSSLLRPSVRGARILHWEDFEETPKPGNAGNGVHVISKPIQELPGQEAYISDMDGLPWMASSLIGPLITHYTTELSSSQLPAHVLLHIGPHLPARIPPALATCILLTYHAQLVSLSLYVQAAHLRNLAYFQYPDVSEHGSYGITTGGAWCTICQKFSKGTRSRSCQRCNRSWAGCPICDGEGPAAIVEKNDLQPSDSLWGWCQWCSHGGHLGCLRVWWQNAEISEGACAEIGCLHDCVSGTRREENLKRNEGAKRPGLVVGDEWMVGDSRAVERARALVGTARPAGKGSETTRPRGPPLATLGHGNSGGKRVRLLVPMGEKKVHGEMDDRVEQSDKPATSDNLT